MKKQTVVMLWACAILLVVVSCVGVYIFGRINEKKQNAAIEVFVCSASEISGYSVEDGDEGYKLVRSRGGWLVEKNSVAAIDVKKAESLVGSAARIVANGKIKKDSFERKETKKIVIELNDGTQKTVSFVGVSGDSSVFTVSGDDGLYTMYTANRDILTPSLNALRRLEIFEFADGDAGSIDSYEYRDNDGTVLCVRHKNADELSKSGTNKYIMTEPYVRSVDDERFEQQILVKLPAIKAEKFVDDFPDGVEKYGLDEAARAALAISCGGKTETLFIGRNDGGLVYAMKEGQDGVFALNSAQLEFLQTEPFYIIEGSLLKAELEKVNRVVVRTGGAEFDIRREDGKDGARRYYINGKDTDEAAFDEGVSAIGKINILGELTVDVKNTADISVLVYYDAPAEVQKIELAETDGKSYAAFVDNKAQFAVDKNVIDDIIKGLAELASEPLK